VNDAQFNETLALLAGADDHVGPDGRPLQAPFPDLSTGVNVLDKRVILQDQIWCNAVRQVFSLERMTPEYRANVIAFLAPLETYWLFQAIIWVGLDTWVGANDPGTARHQLELLSTVPDGWMDRTPLVRRLRSLNEGHRS
jgi:hypothetical protein